MQAELWTITFSVLLHGLWQAALLAGIAWVFLRFAGRRNRLNATTRHAIWVATLIGVVALHGLTAWIVSPYHETPLRAAVVGPADVSSGAVREDVEALASHSHESLPPNTSPRWAPANGTDVGVAVDRRFAHISSTDAEVGIPAAVRSKNADGTMMMPAWMGTLAAILVLLWLGFGVLILLRTVRGLLALSRLKAGGLEVDPGRSAHLSYLTGRSVRVLEHGAIAAPAAAGYARPAVLLPLGFAARTGRSDMEQILLHEAAHLSRRDDWAVLLERLVMACLCMNPFVWLVIRQLGETREMACDEWVVSRTGSPQRYVRTLHTLLDMRLAASSALTPAMAGRPGRLVRRARRLLEEGRAITDRYARNDLILGAVILALGAAVAVFEAPILRLTVGTASVASATGLPGQLVPESKRDTKPGAAAPLAGRMVASSGPADGARPAGGARRSQGIGTLGNVRPLATAQGPEPAGVSTPRESRSAPVEMSPASWVRLLRTTEKIPSDGDKARVLTRAASRMPADVRVQTAYLVAASTIHSPGDRRRALTQLVSHQDLSSDIAVRLVEAVARIPSSGDRASTLVTIAGKFRDDAAVRSAIRKAANDLPAGGDRQRVYRALGIDS